MFLHVMHQNGVYKAEASQVSSHQVKRPNLRCHDIFAQRGNPPWMTSTRKLMLLKGHQSYTLSNQLVSLVSLYPYQLHASTDYAY